MNEQEFVHAFIRRTYRDRLLYELSTEQKRYRGLSRFCHQADDLIDERTILLKSTQLEQDAVFQTFLKQQTGSCQIWSPDPAIDRLCLPLSDAVSAAARSCDAAILLGDGWAAVFTEAEKGGRMKYLLTEKR